MKYAFTWKKNQNTLWNVWPYSKRHETYSKAGYVMLKTITRKAEDEES